MLSIKYVKKKKKNKIYVIYVYIFLACVLSYLLILYIRSFMMFSVKRRTVPWKF